MQTLATKTAHARNLIAAASIYDVPALLSLNQKYLLKNLSEWQLPKGFVKIPYNFQQLITIVNKNEIVVAKKNGLLAGYCLIGSSCKSDALNFQAVVAKNFSIRNAVNFEHIAYGLQVCIDDPFYSEELFAKMSIYFIRYIASQYTHLMCTVSNRNPLKLDAHIQFGWEIIDKTADVNYLYYDVSNCNIRHFDSY